VHDGEAHAAQLDPGHLGQPGAQLGAVVVAVHADQAGGRSCRASSRSTETQSPAWMTTSTSSTAAHTGAGRSFGAHREVGVGDDQDDRHAVQGAERPVQRYTGPMTDTAAQPAAPPEGADPRRWKALSVALAAGFMSLLDVSIVSVALPSIQQGLGTDAAGVQWVVSGYALAFGLALVPAGRLGDAYGRRRLFMLALTAFVLFSALVGAAQSTPWLIVARLAQGLAAGAMAPQNSALIQQLFRGAERGRAFGFFGATVGLSTAIGPVVGGVILALAGPDSGWRWIFLVNVPIGCWRWCSRRGCCPRAAAAGSARTSTWSAACCSGSACWP
jgi:hypothetical protein